MSDRERLSRVCVLAPMRIELEPLVRILDLVAVDDNGRHYRGTVGPLSVDAVLTDIGMRAGRSAARRALADGAEHIVVCGVAGGVDGRIEIGDLIVPETVVDRRTGRVYRPTPPERSMPSGSMSRGSISCADDLITDPAVLAGLAAQGIVAVDMETAAVAAVCEDAGRPWTVFRAISDHAAGGLVDPALFALTGPDGRSDPAALARYLDEDPTRRERLARLASDTGRATEMAASAAAAFCRSLGG